MRTSVMMDDDLMTQAMLYTGLKTKKAVIEEALRTLVRLKSQEKVRELRGKLHWEGVGSKTYPLPLHSGGQGNVKRKVRRVGCA